MVITCHDFQSCCAKHPSLMHVETVLFWHIQIWTICNVTKKNFGGEMFLVLPIQIRICQKWCFLTPRKEGPPLVYDGSKYTHYMYIIYIYCTCYLMLLMNPIRAPSALPSFPAAASQFFRRWRRTSSVTEFWYVHDDSLFCLVKLLVDYAKIIDV